MFFIGAPKAKRNNRYLTEKPPMKIAIIGTGKVGSALASGWAAAGHDILLGVRDLRHFKGAELVGRDHITALPIPDAVASAEVIVLSVPAEAIPAVAPQLKGAEQKVVIDTTNSFRSGPEGFANGFDALLQLTGCLHVVKAFNNTGAENMSDPRYPGGPIDTFVAGDSGKAKAVAGGLAKDLGFGHCHDFGGNKQVALLEQLAFAWINLALVQGMGRDIALTLVKRNKGS
jgi:predicted dinucleotide-binding enzyme